VSHFVVIVLQEIVLVSEVAALGDEADSVFNLEAVDTAGVRARVNRDIGLVSQAVDWSSSLTLVDLQTEESKEDRSESGAAADGTYQAPLQSNVEALLDRWDDPVEKEKKVSIRSLCVLPSKAGGASLSDASFFL
jgi:hypothetical protein